jgi:putative FmdB family regulatory protein
MPIYEYRCRTCGNKFEKLRRMADADLELECPDCQSKKVERMQSAFATAGCGSGPAGRFT